MPRKLKRWKDAAERARSGRKQRLNSPSPEHIITEELPDDDFECTRWTGGVNHHVSSESDSDSDFGLSTSESESEEEFSELEGDDLLESLQRQAAEEAELLKKPTPYEELKRNIQAPEWKKAEAKRGFGYTGNSGRTKRRHEKVARDKGVEDAKSRQT
jgi:hypothetical protein